MNTFQERALRQRQSSSQESNQLNNPIKREDSLNDIDADNDIGNKLSKNNYTTRFDDLQSSDNRFVTYPIVNNTNTCNISNIEDMTPKKNELLRDTSNISNIAKLIDLNESLISNQRCNLSQNNKEDMQSFQDNLDISFRGGVNISPPPNYRHSVLKSTQSKQNKYNGRVSIKSSKEMSGVTGNNNPEISQIRNQSGSFNFGLISPKKKSKFNGNNNNIALIMSKVVQKIYYFYRNYTYHGRTNNINRSIIRNMINDKCDIQSSSQKVKLDKIKEYLKKTRKYFWRLPIFTARMINPQHMLSIYIQMFFIATNFLYFFILSLQLVFQQDIVLSQYMKQYIFYQWIVELIIKLNTAIFLKTNYIDYRKDVIILYLRKKAIFDILPMIIVTISIDSFKIRQLLILLQFLKLVNTLKDKKEVEKQLLMILRSYYIIQFINLVFQLFFVAHIISCIWYFIGKIDQNFLDKEKNWIDLSGQDEQQNWSNIYILSFYWSFTLMATGSNVANTTLEIYFTSAIMLFSTIVFGYMVNTIGIILADMNKQEENQRRDINIINNYMEKKDIPKTLQRRVNLDLENYYLKNLIKKTDEEKEVLCKISQELNDALKLEYNKNILSKIKLLVDNFSADTLKQLCLDVEEVFYSPNQSIFKEDDLQGSSLMYIVSGTVEIFQSQVKKKEKNQKLENFFQMYDIQNKKQYKINFYFKSDWGRQLESERYSKRLGQLKKGQVFGELNFFTGMARKASAKSKDFTTIIKIDREQFIDIIKKKEKDFQTFCEIKDKIMMYSDYSSIKISCQLCSSSFHMTSLCPLAHFNRENQYIIQRFNKSLIQERNPKFTRPQKVLFHPLAQIDLFIEKVELIWEQIGRVQQSEISFYSMNFDKEYDDINSEQQGEEQGDQDDGQFKQEEEQEDYEQKQRNSQNNIEVQTEWNRNRQGTRIIGKIQSNQNIPQNNEQQRLKPTYTSQDYGKFRKNTKSEIDNIIKFESDHDISYILATQSEILFDEPQTKLYSSPSKKQNENHEKLHQEKYKKQQTTTDQKSVMDVILSKKLSQNEENRKRMASKVEKLQTSQNKRNSRQSAQLDNQPIIYDKKIYQKINFLESYVIEEKQRVNIQWAFDHQKDFHFYFPSGNSKNVLNRFNLLRKMFFRKKLFKDISNKMKGESIAKLNKN